MGALQLKPHGRHPVNALTAVSIRAKRTPGRYADGHGLYLEVDPSGAKRWMVRLMVKGRRRDISLGPIALLPLAEAREQTIRMRRIAREGGDPAAERRRERNESLTFKDAATQVIEARRGGWKNAKHARQWEATLERYVYPLIGNEPVSRIDTPDILRVLSPVWTRHPETARRIRQRIGVILDWARAAGLRQGENPVRGIQSGLPRQNQQQRHFAAMPYADLPAFMKLIRAKPPSVSALALEFLILTACRTAEVLGARWDEIDLERRVWTVPASRMKMKREHRVPLSDAAIAVLDQVRQFPPHERDYVFQNPDRSQPLSNMSLLAIMRRMKQRATVHGFRSSFRDWASETTHYSREVCEMALAHTIPNKAEAAYRRGDLFEKRIRLMADWAEWLGEVNVCSPEC